MRNKKGFTLLEVMIIIGIIIIMTAVAIVSLGSARTETKLKAAQREVAAAVKLTQSYALQGKMCLGNSPQFYKFKFYGGSADYGIYCNTTNEEIEVDELGGGAKFYGTGDGEITFSVPYAGVGNARTIIIILSGSTKDVIVSEQGLVTEN